MDATILDLDDFALSERNWLFEGERFGSSVSFFTNRHPPGDGPPAHTHPYDETFLIQEGEGTFVVDGQESVAREGQIVVVPEGAVHSYRNTGDGVLRTVAIQPSPTMQVTWISGEAPV
jgi:quercetin dioxygenase-like cupin family protein